jgi:hypothetical protein
MILQIYHAYSTRVFAVLLKIIAFIKFKGRRKVTNSLLINYKDGVK